jgi:ankyrin repeat protein
MRLNFISIILFILNSIVIGLVDELFFVSCRNGDVDKVKAFLEAGVHVSSRDSKSNTGLIIASGRGQSDVVRLLLSYGASVDENTLVGLFEGKTALNWACSQGRSQTASLLIQAGANPHKPPEKGVFQGKTALMWASSQGRTDVVKLLVSKGVNVDFSSQTGNFKVIKKF